MPDMIKVLETIFAKATTWPKKAQEELARAAQEIEQKHVGVYKLSEEERAAVEEGLAEAKRGEFVSDEDMDAFWNRHRA